MNSSSADAELREGDATAFLDQFPTSFDGILIGGYAISAYGRARFSVDVDLVLSSDQEGPVTRWLAAEHIDASSTLATQSGHHDLSKLRITRGKLSGDLYFGGLRARSTGSEVPYSWIAKDPRPLRLTLTTTSLARPTLVARPEALWVLKLLAGRSQDITDLFTIAGETINTEEIRMKLSDYSSLRERQFLLQVREAVDRGDDFADALSRRGLGSPRLPRNVKLWEGFRGLVDSVISPP